MDSGDGCRARAPGRPARLLRGTPGPPRGRGAGLDHDARRDMGGRALRPVARLLLLLANYGKDGSPLIVPVTVNQETLAAMIGTTRSRVSHFMNKFRRAGFIDYNGTIDVHQSLLTSVLQDAPAIREDEDEPI